MISDFWGWRTSTSKCLPCKRWNRAQLMRHSFPTRNERNPGGELFRIKTHDWKSVKKDWSCWLIRALLVLRCLKQMHMNSQRFQRLKIIISTICRATVLGSRTTISSWEPIIIEDICIPYLFLSIFEIMGITSREALGITRGINIVCAFLMIGLGVYKFIYTREKMTLRTGVWTFYWM